MLFIIHVKPLDSRRRQSVDRDASPRLLTAAPPAAASPALLSPATWPPPRTSLDGEPAGVVAVADGLAHGIEDAPDEAVPVALKVRQYQKDQPQLAADV